MLLNQEKNMKNKLELLENCKFTVLREDIPKKLNNSAHFQVDPVLFTEKHFPQQTFENKSFQSNKKGHNSQFLYFSEFNCRSNQSLEDQSEIAKYPERSNICNKIIRINSHSSSKFQTIARLPHFGILIKTVEHQNFISLVSLLRLLIFFVLFPSVYSMNFECREIERNDLERGFPEILSQLTELGPTERKYELFDEMMKAGTYKIFVIVCEDFPDIVGCATVVLEQKFIHGGGKVAHIEDVVVHEKYRKHGLGGRLVMRCLEEAQNHGCYKAILSCADKNIQFYEKQGFKSKSTQMAKYF